MGRIAGTIALLAFIRLGLFIPLPGLTPELDMRKAALSREFLHLLDPLQVSPYCIAFLSLKCPPTSLTHAFNPNQSKLVWAEDGLHCPKGCTNLVAKGAIKDHLGFKSMCCKALSYCFIVAADALALPCVGSDDHAPGGGGRIDCPC